MPPTETLNRASTSLVPSRRKFPCVDCGGERLYRWDNLKRHRKTRHYNIFYCDTCGEQYPSNDALEQHIGKIHVRTEQLPFSCDSCGVGYSSAAARKRHVNEKHRSEVQHLPCTTCRRLFKLPRYLKDHQRRCRPALVDQPTITSERHRGDELTNSNANPEDTQLNHGTTYALFLWHDENCT